MLRNGRSLIANLPHDAPDSRDEAAVNSIAAGGLSELLRDVFSGGLAGLIAGLVFLGVGSRLVMRAVALLNPDSRSLITDNGNVIGEITAGGTADLVIGTGLFGGLIAGALWVLVRDWLPAHFGVRIPLAGVLAALLGSFVIVSNDNEDFHRLDDAAILNIAMFVGIIGLAGAGTAALDAYVRPRLPAGRAWARVYAPLILLAGLPTLLILIVAFLLGDDESDNQPPRVAGLFLVTVGLATCAGWRRYFRTAEGASVAPWRQLAVKAALAAAALFAALDLAGEINAIL